MVAQKGSEHARNSFYRARVMFSDDPEIPGLVTKSIHRLILQENKILFPCNRRLEQYVGQCGDKPEKIVEKCRAFCESMDNNLLEDIIDSYHVWTKWKHNPDISVVSGRYQLDFEKWWYIPRPLIGEW